MMVPIDPMSLAPLRAFDGEYGIIFSALLLSSSTASTDFGVVNRALSLITRKGRGEALPFRFLRHLSSLEVNRRGRDKK